MTDIKMLAMAATPGKWDSSETRVYLPSNAGGFDIRNSPNAENNADYIAAASPHVVLGLLAERDKLREALAALHDGAVEAKSHYKGLATSYVIRIARKALDEAR